MKKAKEVKCCKKCLRKEYLDINNIDFHNFKLICINKKCPCHSLKDTPETSGETLSILEGEDTKRLKDLKSEKSSLVTPNKNNSKSKRPASQDSSSSFSSTKKITNEMSFSFEKELKINTDWKDKYAKEFPLLKDYPFFDLDTDFGEFYCILRQDLPKYCLDKSIVEKDYKSNYIVKKLLDELQVCLDTKWKKIIKEDYVKKSIKLNRELGIRKRYYISKVLYNDLKNKTLEKQKVFDAIKNNSRKDEFNNDIIDKDNFEKELRE